MARQASSRLTNQTPGLLAPEHTSAKIGGYRWKICALLFFATTLNYMDRQVLALLKPVLQNPVRGIGLTEVQFAAIVSIFSAAYALGLLPFVLIRAMTAPFLARGDTATPVKAAIIAMVVNVALKIALKDTLAQVVA